MSTNNIGFYEDLTKNIFQLSSNTHLISSSGTTKIMSSRVYKNKWIKMVLMTMIFFLCDCKWK